MRLRPRLSHPSLYGSVYLEGFALKCLLGAAAMGVLYGIDWDWDSLFWQLLLWFEALNLRDVIAAMYVLVRVGSLRVPCAEWGMQTGRGVLRELSIGLVAGLLIWSLWRLPRTFADPGASDFLPRYVLDTVVFTPIFEELLYRGLLYRYLRDRMRWLPAAIASSVVFALMHDASRMPLAYVSGIVYALLREWRRSLIAPIAAHASWNLLSTAASGLFCD